MILTGVAIPTNIAPRAALTAVAVIGDHFFIFTRRVKLIVRLASFSNPWTRRMDRRSALGFATFIRRFRTHLPEPSFARWYPTGQQPVLERAGPTARPPAAVPIGVPRNCGTGG